MRTGPARRAHQQYGSSTRNLDRRVAIHSYGTNPLSWPAFVRRHVPFVTGAVVLDVGAGTGVHWRDPAPVRPILLDQHAPMCAALSSLGYPVLQASAELLPVASATVDGVLCTHVLYHVPDPGRAVDEMVRVLKDDGWLALASNGPRHMAVLGDLLTSVGARVPRPHHEHFGIDDVVAALATRRLEPVRHDYVDVLQVTDPGVVVDYCDSLDDALTDLQRQRVMSAVVEAIDELGYFSIEKETALVVART